MIPASADRGTFQEADFTGFGYNHLAIASVADFEYVIDFKGAVHRKTEGQLRLMNHPMIASRPMTF